MQKVLVVFYLGDRYLPMILSLCKELSKRGVASDALLMNSETIRFYPISRKKVPFIVFLYSFLYRKLRQIRGFYRLGLNAFFTRRVYQIIEKDYLMINYSGVFTEDRLGFAKYSKAMGKKLTIDIWGNDFYRVYDWEHDWHKDLFNEVDTIYVSTSKMFNDIVSTCPNSSEKLIVSPIPVPQLDTLCKLMDNEIGRNNSFLSKEAEGRIVLTIGYSGRPWQQHFYVLDAIDRLSDAQKKNLFLLLPMTYYLEHHYMLYIQTRLDQLGIPYQIQTSFLPEIQSLTMRTITDIFVVVQLTDAFAGSVREHIVAGSVLVAGEWLPYDILSEYGVYYHSCNSSSLSETLSDVIDNIKEEKAKCAKNREIMMNHFSIASICEKRIGIINSL